MLHALKQLGLSLHVRDAGDSADKTLDIQGTGGSYPNKEAELYVGNSGTTARFLTASLAFSDGLYRIYGKHRMHERPIGDLVDALSRFGARIQYEQRDRFPPIRIDGIRRNEGPDTPPAVLSTSVSGSISSQFLSAILLAAPLLTEKRPVRIDVLGTLVSRPYVEMSLAVMKSFGAHVDAAEELSTFYLPQGTAYGPAEYGIEPDASAASYYFAAAAVLGGKITVEGLSRRSLQGDVHFVDCLERMGARVAWNDDSITLIRNPDEPLRGITVDMNAISDTAQTLAVVALFAEGPTTIRGIAHARHKETDRIAALATELRKFGACVEEREDGLTIMPPRAVDWPESVEIATYDDHRMAMSFAVAGFRRPGVVILDPRCTEKTYPRFFEDFEKLRVDPAASRQAQP